MRQPRILFMSLLFAILARGTVNAYDPLLDYCLEPYQPILTIVEEIENDVFFGAWTGVSGELVQAYVYPSGAVDFYIDQQIKPCAFPKDLGNLSSITLYPLGGSRWTWAVQDVFGNWHVVKDHGQMVITPPEYDDSGRMITRLVINRNEPVDPSRWHIFDEMGNIAG